MLMDILKKIQKLQDADVVKDTDKEQIVEIYKQVKKISANPDDFKANSERVLNALEIGKCSKETERQWLNYVSNIFMAFMAVQIYGNSISLSGDDVQQILEYCKREHLQKEIAASCVYSCAQRLNETMPMLSYELTEEAFAEFPALAGIYGIDYYYEGKTAENITKNCPFCGATGDEVIPYYCSPQLLKLNHNSFFPPAKLWMKCNCCKNYYTYNFPLTRVDVINGHYTKNMNAENLSVRYSLECYNSIFNRLKALTQGKDYLEIGIGNGEMLAVAQEFGYHVDAVEICREDCERVSAVLNVDVKWCDIVNYITEKQYDIIIMGDVFEHVADPVRVLRKVYGMLKDDGVLWLSTPNYNSAYARMERFSHVMWHELNHYTYVSCESIEMLLRSLGMEIIHYDISSRYRGSMELFIKKVHPSLK